MWTINTQPIDVASDETHLGIQRSLMGAGLHGLNGLHISASLKIWNCYVLPKLEYGLKILPLTTTHKDNMDPYQRQTMR
jgi:hypothetical protein